MGVPNFSVRISIENGPCGNVLNIQLFQSVFGDQRIVASMIADLNAGPAIKDAVEKALADNADQLDSSWDEEI